MPPKAGQKEVISIRRSGVTLKGTNKQNKVGSLNNENNEKLGQLLNRRLMFGFTTVRRHEKKSLEPRSPGKRLNQRQL